jgi:predicted methyltransferase
MTTFQEVRSKIQEVNERRVALAKKFGRRLAPLSERKHIRKAIGYIYHEGGQIEIDILVKKLGIHVKDIGDLLSILEEEFKLVRRSGTKLILTSEGDDFAKQIGFKVRGKEIFPPHLVERIEKTLKEFIEEKLPSPDPYLYQWYFTPQSVIKILEYAIVETDIEGDRVACLMSPTIGLALAVSGYCKEVYVFDADEDMINILKNYYNVNAKVYNISDPIPSILKRFDCVFIDPPYEEDCYYIVFSRAIELLDEPKDKTIYCVAPPAEIAYLMKPGFPPLLISVLPYAKECGLAIEDIAKGICEYLTPPYEAAPLAQRLDIEQKEAIIRKWRCSDLIKFRVFRETTSPIPFSVELPFKTVEREKYKRRFLVRTQIPIEKVYEEPRVEKEEVAKKWDEYLDKFTGPIVAPYYVLIHDVGTWEDPQNRLIKLKGAVAYYLWEKLKNISKIGPDTISDLMVYIKTNFEHAPSEDVIRKHICDYIGKLI